jgi:hypothetical protein
MWCTYYTKQIKKSKIQTYTGLNLFVSVVSKLAFSVLALSSVTLGSSTRFFHPRARRSSSALSLTYTFVFIASSPGQTSAVFTVVAVEVSCIRATTQQDNV